MDRAGRLVIPKEIRREARLAPGALLEVRWRDGRIEIEAVPVAVQLRRRGRLLVAVPRTKIAPLTLEIVDQTRRGIVARRAVRFSSEDIHRALFAKAPRKRTLRELKERAQR